MEKKIIVYDVTAQCTGDTAPRVVCSLTTADQAKTTLMTMADEYMQAIGGVDAKLGLIGRTAYKTMVDDENILVVRTATRQVMELSVHTRVVHVEMDQFALRQWAETEVTSK